MPTFADALAAQLRRDAGRPFITFYDHATGERTELSVTTYANWVAKAASLLAEEADLDRGSRLHVDLPPHWMSTVFLGAAWTLGATVVMRTPPDDLPGVELDAVVTGPHGLERWAGSGVRAVLACSLHPLGRPFTEPLPAGVLDVGVEIWSQPDAFTPWDPPTDADLAVVARELELRQGEMMLAATAGSLLTDGGRLLSVADPASPPGTVTLTEPLVRSGSLVLVRNPDPARLDEVYAAERATARV